MKISLFALLLGCAGCARVHVAPPALAAPSVEEAEHPDGYLEAAEYFRERRLPVGETVLPLDRYETARVHVRQMRRSSARLMDVAVSQWTALGPGNVGGRTRSFLIDPGNPSTMYAGGVTGGVWKTTDAGKSWNPTFDALPSVSIGAMAMDPKNSQVIYAGTGEYYQAFGGQGIFKTTDGGASWAVLPQTANPSPSNFDFYYVNRLAVSPNDSNRVYATTANGLWESLDAGQTWTHVTAIKNSVGCESLVLRAEQATDFVFVACSAPAGGGAHVIYRNADASGSGDWVAVQTAPNMGRTELAIAPSQPSTIYAISGNTDSTSKYSNALLAVYRSTADGDAGSWTVQVSNADANRLNTALLSYPGSAFADVCSGGTPSYNGQASYDLAIAVDPLDAQRVWVGGADLFRSDDGGANWGIAMFWEAGAPRGAHADNHALVFHPRFDGAGNQTLYSLSDGGIFETDQARGFTAAGAKAACRPYTNGIDWTSLNNGYAVTQFYHGAVYPGASGYFGGAQDNGTQRGTDQLGVNKWYSLFGGDGGDVAVDAANANTIYFEYVNLEDFLKSTDGGRTAVKATNGITEDSKDFSFIAKFTMDPNNSQRLYIGGYTLWRTSDGASNWSAATGALPAGQGNVRAIAVAAGDANRVAFGTSGGQIYTTASALTASDFTAWTGTRPRSGIVSGLAFDPVDPQVIYATYSTFNSAGASHVYKSYDGGQTWAGIDGAGGSGVPDMPVLTVKVDPRNNQNVYLGTDQGMLVSTDAGATWAHDVDPFPSAIVEEILFDYAGNAANLVVFSYGRGVWRLPLGTAQANCVYSVTPVTVNIGAEGGSGSVAVATGDGCPWVSLPGLSGGSFVRPQAPAKGVGAGPAFYSVDFNSGTGPRTGEILVQGQAVSFTQAGAGQINSVLHDEVGTAAVTSLPYTAIADTRLATVNAGDPVHSCTGSADFKTTWWEFVAPATGTVALQGFGARYDVFGDFGLVLSAYPLVGGAVGDELACVAVKRGTGASTTLSAQFAVESGKTYLVEASASTNDGGFVALTYGMSQVGSVAVTPGSVSLGAGQQQQFSAGLTGNSNGAVRWSLSPEVGVIGADGTYAAPSVVGTQQTVTVTATSLANPGVQGTAVVTLAPF